MEMKKTTFPDAAKAMGISVRTLFNYKLRGMPCNYVSGWNFCNVEEVKAWMLSQNLNGKGGRKRPLITALGGAK